MAYASVVRASDIPFHAHEMNSCILSLAIFMFIVVLVEQQQRRY